MSTIAQIDRQIDIFQYMQSLQPHRHESTSSRAGAEHAQPYAGTQCEKVYAALKAQGSYGATSCELRRLTGISQKSTMSARINSLEKQGKIRKAGRTRVSEDHVQIEVYEALA